MAYKRVSYDLIGQVLSRDLFTDRGILLLSEGTRIQESDITMLMNRGIYKISVVDNHVSSKIGNQMKDLWDQEGNEVNEEYLISLENTKTLFHQAINSKIPPLEEFMKTYTPMLERVLESTYVFNPIHKIKGHDEYNYRHCVNVGLICGIIGKILGLTLEENFTLGQMGLLHDIGKMKIRDEVLYKPGKLTSEEFEEIKRHTYYGYELLIRMQGANDLICKGALYHHERLDGSGYPKGLKGEDIPFFVQILSVADTYDAICSDRVYQQKSSPYFAVRELMQEVYKGRLNPKIVIPFVRYIMEAYLGEKAVLDDGTVADVVFLHPEEPDRPLIKVGETYIDLRKQRNVNILDLIAKSS
jgi:HD-GYP domain-containing protein (c-di-GMP phosphodiesterase class II)